MPCPESHTDATEQAQQEADYRRDVEQDREMMTNPNPMNARCGLGGCDCEYTIGGLVRRLEVLAEDAMRTVQRTRQEAEALTDCHTGLCGTGCPCYQDGYEAERRP